MQDIRAVEEQIQEQQRTEEVEVSVADGGEKERTIPAPEADLRPHFAGEIDIEFFARIRRRHARDAKAGEKSKDGEREEDDAGQPWRVVKIPGHERRRDGAKDNGHKRAEFQHAIAPGKS